MSSMKEKNRRRASARAARDKRSGGEKELEKDEMKDDAGIRQKVLRRGVALKGFEDELISAAARFAKDWNLANAGTMRGMPWQERVQGGSPDHLAHMTRLDAQRRLREVEAKIGQVGILVATAVCVYGISAPTMHREGGPPRKDITKDIKGVLRQIGEYYDRRPRRRDPMMDLLTRLIEKAQNEPD